MPRYIVLCCPLSRRQMNSRQLPSPPAPSQLHAWIIWASATLLPIYQLAIQIGFGSLQSAIGRDVNLSIVQAAVVSGSFLVAYSLMQLPAGLLLDRFGPRILLAISATLCGVSAWFFAESVSFSSLLVSRFALGAFAAVGFPAAGLLGRRWIRPSCFVLSMGLIDFFFGLGAIGGEAGFALLQDVGLSWREIMNALAFVGIVIGVLCGIIVRDRPVGMDDRSSRVHLLDAMSVLLSNRQVLLAIVYYGGMIGVAFGFGGLWDIPLQEAYGFIGSDAVYLNSWLFVGIAVSAPVSGVLADRMASRRPLLLLGPICALLGVCGLLFIPSILPYWLLVANLVFTGAFLGTSVAIFGVVCDAVPPRYEATTIGLVNAAGCMMGAVLQVLPGILLGSGDAYPLSLLQQVLSLNIVVLVFAAVAVLFLKEGARAEKG